MSINTPSNFSWSIKDIDHLSFVDGTSIDKNGVQKIPSGKKIRYITLFNKILEHPDVKKMLNSLKPDSLYIQMDAEGLSLLSNGKVIFLMPKEKLLNGNEDDPFYLFFKESEKIREYSRDMGLGAPSSSGPSSIAYKEEVVSRELVKKIYPGAQSAIVKEKAMSEASRSQLLESVKNLPAVCGDAGGLIRNLIIAARAGLITSTFITGLGLLGGVCTLLSGLLCVKGGQELRESSEKVGFTKGVYQARLLELNAYSLIFLGLGTTLTKSAALGPVGGMSYASQIADLASPLSALMTPLSLLTSLTTIGFGIYGYCRTDLFYKKCLEYLDNPHVTSLQRCRGFMQFLKSELSLTPFELMKIKADVQKKHPGLSSHEFEMKFQAELEKTIKCKKLKMDQRIGASLATKIAGSVDGLLARLNNPQLEEGVLHEATALSLELKKEVFKKKVYWAVMIFIGVLGFAATLVGAFFTGPVPFILFALIAFLWLLLDQPHLSNQTGELAWKIFYPEESNPALELSRPAVSALSR